MQKKLLRACLFAGAALAVALASGCSTYASAGGGATAAVAASGASAAVAASDTTAVQTQAQKLSALAKKIDTDCQVGQPFVKSLLAMQTDQGAISVLATVQKDSDSLCDVASRIVNAADSANAPTLDLASVKSFLDSQVPSLISLITASNLNSTQKTAANLAITGIQTGLTLALANAQ